MTLPKLLQGGLRLLPSRLPRRAGRILNARVYTAAVLGALILLNVLAARFPWRYDATHDKAFTLTPETKAVLEQLPGHVEALGFYSSDSPGEQHLTDLLKEYAATSKGKFTWQTVDPAANPSLVQRYDVSAPGTTILTYGEKHEKLDQWDVVGGMDPAGRPQVAGEQALTNGLLRLTAAHSPRAYFLNGHGETELSALQRHLRDGGYSQVPLSFTTQPAVPQDADLVVIAGPVRDFTPHEVDLLGQWADQKGGKLLVMLPPGQRLPRLEAWLDSKWGVTVRNDMVVDPASHYMYDPASPVPDYRYHTITTRLAKARLGMVMPGTRSLAHAKEHKDLAYQDLLVSSGKAWGETTLTGPARQDAQDVAGPLTMALAVTRPQSTAPPKPGARLVVVGSAAFAADDALQFPGNLDFTMATLNWLADRGDAVTVRPRDALAAPLLLTNNAAIGLFVATVLAIPLLFMAGGGAVWYRRRHL